MTENPRQAIWLAVGFVFVGTVLTPASCFFAHKLYQFIQILVLCMLISNEILCQMLSTVGSPWPSFCMILFFSCEYTSHESINRKGILLWFQYQHSHKYWTGSAGRWPRFQSYIYVAHFSSTINADRGEWRTYQTRHTGDAAYSAQKLPLIGK